MKKELKYVAVCAEWGDTAGLLDNLKIALKHLDIYVIDDPRCAESDLLGIIVSNRKVTKKELTMINEEG